MPIASPTEYAAMTPADPRHAELVAWLEEQGRTDGEIAKILDQLERYDAQLVNESIFDSIARGDFDLTAFIQKTLAED